MFESERLFAVWGGLETCSAVIKTWLASEHSLGVAWEKVHIIFLTGHSPLTAGIGTIRSCGVLLQSKKL